MARKTITGLYAQNGIWHIDKLVRGERIRESTGTTSREEAEQYLVRVLETKRQAKLFGVRTVHTFREAATRYLQEALEEKQPSINISLTYLEQADPFVGRLPLTHVDNDSLKPFIRWMKIGGTMPDGKKLKKPSSNRTINIALQRIVRVLNCAHRLYRDEVGDRKLPWLEAVPSITMLDENKTRRPPYPMSWDEQRIFFRELPSYLERMALFKVNTGTREQEVCKLSWDWEVFVPELNTSVFIVPADFGGRSENSGVKNREERVVILNDVAKSVIEAQRGKHPKYVFPYKNHALHRMNDTAWQSARERAAMKWEDEFGKTAHRLYASLRVHDLKHTFGRRLKAANVTLEDRQVLLGHKSGSVTVHYSGSEIQALIDAANRVSATNTKTPTLTILRSNVMRKCG